MYSLVKNYMFEATYWVIAVVYDKTSDLVTIVSFSSRDNIHKPEAQQTDIKDVQTSMKKNTSWGHFSTGTFTPDREFYATNQSLRS